MQSKLLVVCTFGALVYFAVAQPASPEAQQEDSGSVLDTISAVVDDAEDAATAAAANETGALSDLLPSIVSDASSITSDLLSLYAAAKCPVDVSSVIAPSDVQDMQSACVLAVLSADPSKAVDSDYCAGCTCAYYKVIIAASQRAEVINTAQVGAGSLTEPEIGESIALLKCVEEADNVLRTAIGEAATTEWQQTCSQTTETPQFAVQIYQQCLQTIMAPNVTAQNGSPSPDASPALVESDDTTSTNAATPATPSQETGSTRAANISAGGATTGGSTEGNTRSAGTMAYISQGYMLLMLVANAAFARGI